MLKHDVKCTIDKELVYSSALAEFLSKRLLVPREKVGDNVIPKNKLGDSIIKNINQYYKVNDDPEEKLNNVRKM